MRIKDKISRVVLILKHSPLHFYRQIITALFLKRKNREKKKIALLAHHSLSFGGVEKVIIDVANSLREDFIVVIVATDNKKNDWKEHFKKNTDYVFFNDIYYPKIIRDKIFLMLIDIISPSVLVFSNSPAVERCLEKVKKRKPVISVVDIIHSDMNVEGRLLFDKIEYIDKRVVISRRLKDAVCKAYDEYGLEKYKDRLTLIYNGIDSTYLNIESSRNYLRERFGIKEKHKVVFVGRLDRDKDPETFIEIAIKYGGEDLAFILVGGVTHGSSEYYKRIEKRAEKKKNIYLLGYIDDVKSIYREADIMIVTSPWEGVPIAILEAMACGLKVIAGNVGAIDEIIENGKNGILLDRDSGFPENVCKYIKLMVENPDKYEEMSDEARKTIEEKFTIKRLYFEYLSLIRCLTV